MPTARYGEACSQASIFHCSGAWHWSKPSPVKVPGVTGLLNSCLGTTRPATATEPAEAEGFEEPSAPAGAGASPAAVVASTTVAAMPMKVVVVRRRMRGLLGDGPGRLPKHRRSLQAHPSPGSC